jgi:hypothetical protein
MLRLEQFSQVPIASIFKHSLPAFPWGTLPSGVLALITAPTVPCGPQGTYKVLKF